MSTVTASNSMAFRERIQIRVLHPLGQKVYRLRVTQQDTSRRKDTTCNKKINRDRTDVTGKMARDRLGSDYSENLSDATTCSCMTSSVDKCSLRSCGMLQEPFFLHPPGSRPRDGIYINPMSAFIGESQKPKDTQSFYLHSPHDLVYTRITHLFSDSEESRNAERVERKDETLTVKVDVHINNRNYKSIGNGTTIRTDSIKDTEHAYEQICLHRDETDSVTSSHKNHSDNVSDSSKSSKSSMTKSSKNDRRYSRSSSISDSSNVHSEIHGYSSPISTPSLSRNSSNEHINKSPKVPELRIPERKQSNTSQGESEKDIKILVHTGPSLVKPPPPPPPPPPDTEEIIVVNAKIVESNNNNSNNNNNNLRDDKKDLYEGSPDTKSESGSVSSAANKSDVSCEQPEVAPASPPAEPEETKPSQVSHLVNRHMVLPFIPPQFATAADSNTLLKPSEYLKSICKSTGKNSLSKARSVDNLDIQSRVREEEAGEGESKEEGSTDTPPGPPPPPLPPLQKNREYQGSISVEPETPRTPQPLATISIQDLTSVQLRRTNSKMHATKTFSAPPPRSVSMTNVSEPFFVQKTDLIAELKKTRDIPGIKKLKVERAQVEKTQEQHLMTEMSKAFSAQNFVDQIPEKDSSGNVIPIWKRQMLARKAAERAKKELEEQIARENEERRQKAIPAWKRQLLAKKDNEEKKSTTAAPNNPTIQPVKIELTPAPKRDASPVPVARNNDEKMENEDKRNGIKNEDPDDTQIIPWRAQLRKTNSKLNIID
ncbi:espin isoform X2 [Cephus cinctus]|uniref:Espin isoform X2 n=1 Tax=Cephus cinctus TaxID=211228 RepID=A0AAJ7RUI5_CEPCN|nr:espin isoform X2 [Cephus cinctus]